MRVWDRLAWLLGAVVVSFAISAMTTAPVRACTMTADYFDYDEGENLDGQAGGGEGAGAVWVGSWEAEDNTTTGGADTPVDAFVIEAGEVVSVETAGEEYRVSRDMDLSGTENLGYGIDDELDVPIHQPGTTFFTGEMMAVSNPGTTRTLDTPGAWRATIEFQDDFGVTAGFGMMSDGTDQHFFGILGDQEQLSAKEVVEDTAYWLYGVLDQDADVNDNERLRVWINPLFTDMYNGLNADIDMYNDLDAGLAPGEERAGLGTEMILTAQTSSVDTAPPSFAYDDIQVARDIELLSVPRLDIGQGAARIQEGWEEWNADNLPDTNITNSYDLQLYYPSLEAGVFLVDITVESLTPGEDLTFFDETFGTSGENDDLRGDGISGTDGLLLTLSGLMGDMYLVKLFSYNATEDSLVNVFISTDGVSFHERGSFTTQTGTSAASELNVDFDNHDPLLFGEYLHAGLTTYIRLEAANPGETVSLVGLQFIPEPGTGLLFGLGLAGMAWRRQRQLGR